MRKEEVAYCICRTSETDRFMIGCDNCNEWYHGDCISITEEFAKRIQKFYCLMCRDKDPNLVIKIKEKKSTKKEKNESNLLVSFVFLSCFNVYYYYTFTLFMFFLDL